jgi:ABC-type sugar transport system ATPase subunit
MPARVARSAPWHGLSEGGGTQSSGLTLDKVAIRYGETIVLRQIDLEVRQGELIALLGSSGCGKTSLLRAVAGFVPLASGRILVGDADITHLPAERRQCAMMFSRMPVYLHERGQNILDCGAQVAERQDRRAGRRNVAPLQLELGSAASNNSPALAAAVAMGRALAIRPCCCSTSRCPTWTTGSGWSYGTRSAPCNSGWGSPRFM